MNVGTVVKLKTPMLGNDVGAIGIGFSAYPDFDDSSKNGVQFIFENGDYDGFSVEEQKDYLEEIGFSKEHSEYQFMNVMKVSQDFRNGYWNKIFNHGN